MDSSHRPVKKARKASTLTNTRKCPPQCRAIYERNIEDSPLLRVPAELRNRIYEEVLANKTIHIDHYECPDYMKGGVDASTLYREKPDSLRNTLKVSHAICQADESEKHVYARSKACSIERGCSWPTIEEYDKRHGPCHKIFRLLEGADIDEDGALGAIWEEGPDLYLQKARLLQQKYAHSRLDLSLLGVSRQIHKEAALIPYESNTFAFTSGYVLDFFISKILLAPQREAIKSIQAGNWLRGTEIRFQSIKPSTVLSLTNLTSLEVALEYHHGFPNNGIQHFILLGLETARVYIHSRTWLDPQDGEPNGQCGELCRKNKLVVDEVEMLLKEDSGRRTAAIKARAEKKGNRKSRKRSTVKHSESNEENCASKVPKRDSSKTPRRSRLD